MAKILSSIVPGETKNFTLTVSGETGGLATGDTVTLRIKTAVDDLDVNSLVEKAATGIEEAAGAFVATFNLVPVDTETLLPGVRFYDFEWAALGGDVFVYPQDGPGRVDVLNRVSEAA